ncbi:glycosyltransferase family 2 protein [Zobellia nedashkovskayae]|uniref:glycosyltransferase family 2 protein n=1 Tax=Zobellia nedashkovskayae TaxID=2779510 RepID=UPI00188BB919|nr:glycosyltransferase family 2 protein [Zobellia nedashkovskayae]
MLTAAIVLYNNNEKVLRQAVDSFLSVPLEKRLYLVDNSETDAFRTCFVSDEITYIHTGKNIGFGKGHNWILEELEAKSKFHLILNPDAYFEPNTIPQLIKEIVNRDKVGIIAPKILYPDGSFQLSIRRFPKIYDFFLRRIPGIKNIFKDTFKKGNYLNGPLDKPMNVEAVSGCFQVFDTNVFTKIKGFDERYFMYMEDLDICRKVHEAGYNVLYYPLVTVYHHSAYDSKKKPKLLLIHLSSIVKYFIKWNT